MGDKIEEKWPLYLSIHLTIIVSGFSWMILVIFIDLLKLGINSNTIGNLFWILPGIIISMVLLGSPYKIMVEDDLLYITRIFGKTLAIPLTTISKIETKGDISANRHFYIIEYDGKKIYLLTLSLRFGDSFNLFINELQRRVDIAKMEV